MPFSYMTMSASSNDGSEHSLRLYSEVTGGQYDSLHLHRSFYLTISRLSSDFLAGFRPVQLINWSADDSGQYVVLYAELETPLEYTEINNHAADATEYYAFKKVYSFNIIKN